MKEPETGKKENTGKSGYSITTWRLHLWCRHPEWLRTTQEFYNRIAEFYYNLLLDHTDLWELGSQQTLRELEIMSIPGRGGRIPSDPLPWQKVPLYFRRAAANEGIASAKSYISRFAQDEKIGRAEKLNAAVTYYKGIHDAIEAGFNHVVFIIRKDIEKEFKEVIGNRIASICSSHNVTVDYAFQDINDIPGELPAGRTKPWGTGQAVLAAKKVIMTPFIVINADDYYGKEGFKAVHEYLVDGGESCMAGFVLKNTLSDNGGVTRGICKMDEGNNLTEVVETKNIVKTATGAEADGVAVDVNSLVSMNMCGDWLLIFWMCWKRASKSSSRKKYRVILRKPSI